MRSVASCAAYAYASREDRRRDEQHEPDGDAARVRAGQLVDRRDDEPERERAHEVAAVEPDRLGDELADRALAQAGAAAAARARARFAPRAIGGRLLDATASSSRGSASSSASSARRILQRDAVALADLVRDRAHLDRRHARERAGAQDREALHRLDPHSCCAAPPTAALVPIGSDERLGNASRSAASSAGVGLDPVDDRDLRGEVAVDGLAADHERRPA